MNDALIVGMGLLAYAVLWATTLGAFKPLSMNRSGIYILVTGLGAGLVFGADRFIQEGVALNALARMLAESAYLALVLFLRSVRLPLTRGQEVYASVLVLLATMLHLTLNLTLEGAVLFTVMAVQIVLLFCWVLRESYLLWRAQPSGMTLMLVILVGLHVLFEVTARSAIGWQLLTDPDGTGALWKQLLDTSTWVTFSIGYVVLTATASVLMDAFRSDKMRLEQVLQGVEARLRDKESTLLSLMRVNSRQGTDPGMAGLAHELRQPLQSIQLGAEFLSMGKARDRAEEAEILETILRENRRAADLVQGLRNVFLSDAPEQTTLLPLSSWMTDWVQSRAPALLRDQGIVLQLHAQAHVVVQIHAAQFEMMLQNLVTNAVQAMAGQPRGSVHVSLVSQDQMARVDVVDNGPGLPEGLATRVFEMGFTTKPEGMGFGLWLSRRIAELHGGHLIHVPTERGTHMQLCLPLAAA